MTHAEKYAKQLQSDYGIEQIDTNLNDKTFDTVQKVAAEVLPSEKYQEWLRDFRKEVNNLREKFGIEGRI